MHIKDEQLKEFILDAGLVSRAAFEKAEKHAQEEKLSVGEVLVSEGELSDDDLRRVQAYVLGIPFVNLKGLKLDFETLALIPEPIARNNNIVAFKKSADTLEVAMLDTDNLSAIDFIKKKTGLKIVPRLTDTDSIKNALLQYQKTLRDEFGDMIERESASLRTLPEDGAEVSEKDLKQLAEDLPVVRIVDALLRHAIIQTSTLSRPIKRC